MMERISNALAIVRRLEQEGYEAAIVGGAVRDLFLGRAELSDVDVATSAGLEAIRSLWEGRVKVTRKGPPWTAVIPVDGFNVEVTPFLGETLEEDLKRRDFTVNALAMKADGKLIDVVDGVKDLSRRVLRFNGEAAARIREDPLRALRLARFAAVLPAFVVDEASLSAAHGWQDAMSRMSKERIGKEVLCAMRGDAVRFTAFLKELGLVKTLLPGLSSETEARLAYANAATDRAEVKAACLLDGMARAKILEMQGSAAFEGHLGRRIAKAADQIMSAWAWPHKLADHVAMLVKWQEVAHSDPSPWVFLQLLKSFGRTWLDDLFLLAWADAMADGKGLSAWARNRITAVCLEVSTPQPLLSGEDVMEVLGIGEGPEVGRILEAIEKAQAEGKVCTREDALRLADALYKGPSYQDG